MIDKSNEHSPKSNPPKPTEEDKTEVKNFKLLYRNIANSEIDKSSGASSDEETSSSLVPVPDTLRHVKNKLKRNVNDSEHSDCNISNVMEKTTENVKDSFEEIRKKYTLKNETSVALKMNSANLILDDILNSANLNVTSNNNRQTRFFRQQEVNSKTLSYINTNNEINETSTTESSVSVTKHYPHILDHPHSIEYELFPSSCVSQESFSKSLQSPVEKEFLEISRKKSLLEKIQDFRTKCKLQSVYRALQKTRNPFAKSKKDSDLLKISQGIPGVTYQENDKLVYKCENCTKQIRPKRLNLDLVESSELSHSDCNSLGREHCHCTCLSQRECNCPELIPNCKCMMMSSEINCGIPRRNLQHSEALNNKNNNNNEYIHEAQSEQSMSIKRESSNSTEKENEENKSKKRKNNSLSKHFQENKYCSRERRIIERTDIYYFDHGNSAYYQTTDHHPIRYTECLVERTDHYATKFWAEFFGTIEIGVAFLISFFLQFYRFLFTSVIRSLTVGVLQIFSDYFFKPLLTIFFNGIIQPILILGYNIATSVRDLCLPISQIFGFFAKEVAIILKSCRLVEVSRDKQPSCYCGNKV